MIEFTNNHWKPTTVVFIQSLVWSKQNVTLNFLCQEREHGKEWPNRLEDFVEVEVQFRNIMQFKLNFGGADKQAILGFDVVDISAKGWENINFKIEDYENDRISFFCEAIEVLHVFPKAKLKL